MKVFFGGGGFSHTYIQHTLFLCLGGDIISSNISSGNVSLMIEGGENSTLASFCKDLLWKVDKSNLKKNSFVWHCILSQRQEIQTRCRYLIKNSSVHYMCTYNAINTLHLAVCSNKIFWQKTKPTKWSTLKQFSWYAGIYDRYHIKNNVLNPLSANLLINQFP